MLSPAADAGFLQINRSARYVLFEGDHQRWKIPADSLVSVDVGSYVPIGKLEPAHTNSSADRQHEERYFLTVIQARVGDRDCEAPASKRQLEWRARTNRLRETNALNVRDEIQDLIPSGWAPADREIPVRPAELPSRLLEIDWPVGGSPSGEGVRMRTSISSRYRTHAVRRFA